MHNELLICTILFMLYSIKVIFNKCSVNSKLIKKNITSIKNMNYTEESTVLFFTKASLKKGLFVRKLYYKR